jgi:hypothetical protein
MKAGQVVEVGSHSDLIAKPGGTYATLGERTHPCDGLKLLKAMKSIIRGELQVYDALQPC